MAFAVARAAVGAWARGAGRARVAVDAVARALHAHAVPAAVLRAARLLAGLAGGVLLAEARVYLVLAMLRIGIE